MPTTYSAATSSRTTSRIELGLGGTGDLEESFTDTVPGIGTVTLEVDADATLYSLSLLGMLPFDRMSLFAGVGYFNAGFEGDVNVVGFGGGSFDGGHDHGALANFGIQHDFGLDLKSFSIRAQYDWYDFPDEIDASGFTPLHAVPVLALRAQRASASGSRSDCRATPSRP